MSTTGHLAYGDALRALQDRGRFGIRLGLGRTRAFLRALGDPQRELRGVLIGGTNGKGSVLALTASALRAAGYRVGETPKPHLVSYRERLVIDGRPIDRTTFARLVEETLPLAARVARRLGEPTEFELLTAMIFRWFADEAIDVAVVEVGLGGRLDATHAWDGGVAAITNVALDHTDRLGTTIPAIAREKAAIIERGDLAVTGATGEALEVVRRRARRVGAPLTEVGPARIVAIGRDGVTVDLASTGETAVGLRGRHQAANAAVADAILDALGDAGIARVSRGQRMAGFRDARWPGRLELLEVDGPAGRRDVLLDGAHNPAGAIALATALDDLRPFLAGGLRSSPPGSPTGPVTFVVATMIDKDVDGIIGALMTSSVAASASVIATQVEAPRARPADDMARHWQMAAPGSAVVAEPDPGAALDRALRGPGPVVIAGSLYLVGAMRSRLVPDAIRDDDGHGRAGGPDGAGADAREPVTRRRALRPRAVPR